MSFFVLLAIFTCFTKLCYCEKPCSPNYMRLTPQHTMCGVPNPKCVIMKKGVNEEDKLLILKLHNTNRNKVATGKETLLGGFPSAADMMEMTWDDELAKIAQTHAERCKFEHDCNECRAVDHFSVGQNLAQNMVFLMQSAEEKDWIWFMKSLYDEAAQFPKSTLGAYVPGTSDPATQYGHFSQVIWANSWRVGCGWVLFKEANMNISYFACNYGPGGNVRNRAVYTIGPPCSSCPRNSCCGDKCAEFKIKVNYPGLCKVIKENLPPDGFGPHDKDDYFFCDFNDEDDCKFKMTGKSNWTTIKTIGGNWMSITLNDCEDAKLLAGPFKSRTPKFCFKIVFRTEAKVDGVVSIQGDSGMKFFGYLKGSPGRFIFTTYRMDVDLPPDKDLTAKFNFTVQAGAPPQQVDIKEISARAGECPSFSNQG